MVKKICSIVDVRPSTENRQSISHWTQQIRKIYSIKKVMCHLRFGVPKYFPYSEKTRFLGHNVFSRRLDSPQSLL